MRVTKKPKFIRCGGKNRKKVGEKWRAPRGRTNKLRRYKKNRGNLPQPGYGTPKSLRGLHPSGLEEIMIQNISDIQNINKEKQALRLSSKIGNKKRIEIQKKAEELGIRVLNTRKIEPKVNKEKKKEEPKTEEKPKKKE